MAERYLLEKEDFDLSERELKINLEDRLPDICKLLIKGKDVEIRNDVGGIKVISLDKKVINKQ